MRCAVHACYNCDTGRARAGVSMFECPVVVLMHRSPRRPAVFFLFSFLCLSPEVPVGMRYCAFEVYCVPCCMKVGRHEVNFCSCYSGMHVCLCSHARSCFWRCCHHVLSLLSVHACLSVALCQFIVCAHSEGGFFRTSFHA